MLRAKLLYYKWMYKRVLSTPAYNHGELYEGEKWINEVTKFQSFYWYEFYYKSKIDKGPFIVGPV